MKVYSIYYIQCTLCFSFNHVHYNRQFFIFCFKDVSSCYAGTDNMSNCSQHVLYSMYCTHWLDLSCLSLFLSVDSTYPADTASSKAHPRYICHPRHHMRACQKCLVFYICRTFCRSCFTNGKNVA